MKTIVPTGNYTFNATTKVITISGAEFGQDRLLLVANVTRGVTYFTFASSTLRAQVANPSVNITTITLLDASTVGHANSDALAIHWDNSKAIASSQDVAGIGLSSDTMAVSDTDNSSIVAHIKRHNVHLAALRNELGGGGNAVGGGNSIGLRNDAIPINAIDSGSVIAFLKRLNSAFDTVFGSSYLSLNNSQATFRVSHPYGTISPASPAYIIAPNTPQLLFSAKTNATPRRFLQIQNVSDTPMYVGFGNGFLANPMASGAVNAVQITNGGSAYLTAPTVTFSAPTGSTGKIATATGVAVISGGVVTSIQITDGGGGYISAPTITFGSGSATATATIGSVGWYLATTFGSIGFDRGFIPNDAVYIACATAGKAFVAFQA